MDNNDRIKKLERIGVAPNYKHKYTDGVINPYRSVALAMIERGEEVPNELVEQINYFNEHKNDKMNNMSENTEAVNISASPVFIFMHLALMPILALVLVMIMKTGNTIMESSNPYNRITEFVSSYGLSVPEDKYEETFKIIDKQFWNDEMAVVELVDADGNIDTYALAGHYEHYGKGVPGLELTQIFDIKDDGSYKPLEKQVEK